MTTEDLIQKNIVRAVRLYYPKGLIFSVPNGGKRGKALAGILKATGVLPGVSDLIFLSAGKILFMETKTPTGTQSPEQKDFERKITAMGFPYVIVRSGADALDRIAELLKSN